MNRQNIIYLVIGVLVTAVAVLGYQYYQDRQDTSRIEIEIGKGGISIDRK